MILFTLIFGSSVAATTVTSGRVTGATTGTPPPWGNVGLITRNSLDDYAPGTSVWPDLIADLDGLGDYVFLVNDTDPNYHEFYVFSLSPFHFNQIYNGVFGTLALPLKEDFHDGGVAALDGRQSNTQINFSIPSNNTTERVLMRDGVTELATDIYRARPGVGSDPVTAAPTILMRTVYNKDYSADLANYTLYGYNAVVQDSRGRFASDGIDPVFRDDAWGMNQDGYDTVEWIAAQPFSNGKVGMYGGSALGITQYLTAGAVPPHLTCCYAVVGTGNLYDGFFFTGGVFRKAMIEGWLEGQKSLHFLPDLEAHPNRDQWWDAVDTVTRQQEIQVPTFHIGGWFDILQEGTARGFHDLQYHGGDNARGKQKMLIGPWTHGNLYGTRQGELTFPANAAIDNGFTDPLRFFDYWLKGIANGLYDTPAIRYYVMGDVDDPGAPGNQWRDAEDWPPLSASVPFYFWSDGTLRREPPESQTGQRDRTKLIYAYNPADPVPTLGGANLLLPAGPFDQRRNEARDDVVTFTTAPLGQPLEITGRLTARLYVSSTVPDTDFMVKLCDVYPDGRSMLIQEGAFRTRHRVDDRSEHLLEPGVTYQINVDLWGTSIVFNKGHRIRVSVTSSNDPRYDPNPNTGEPFRQQTRLEIAVNTLHCAPPAASRIILPVIGGGPLPPAGGVVAP